MRREGYERLTHAVQTQTPETETHRLCLVRTWTALPAVPHDVVLHTLWKGDITMTAHVHAENMALYAQDAAETEEPWLLWEYAPPYDTSNFVQADDHPGWEPTMIYRRIDPYRSYKEALAAGKVIERHLTLFEYQKTDVDNPVWVTDKDPDWSSPPDRYRIKPDTVEMFEFTIRVSSQDPTLSELQQRLAEAFENRADWTRIEMDL